MPQVPTTEDEPQNDRRFLAPPPGLARPRNGAQIGLNGDPDPLRLRLGLAGIDAMPSGFRPRARPSKAPR
jgi:hypothetical protein